MALLVKCLSCKKKVPSDQESCPACGSSELHFIVDYRPKGRWGPRRRVHLPDTTKTPAAAKAFESAFLRTIRSVPVRIAADSDSTVSDLFPRYLTWYKLHRAESSWRDLSNAWNRDIFRIMGEHVVKNINEEHFELYQGLRGGMKVSNRTINKELDYFRGFLRWCRKEKKIDVARIEVDDLPYNREPPIVFSPQEIQKIVEAAESEPVWHALILCLYTLGIRISSARRLRPEDFDFSNKVVRIVQKGGSWRMLPLNDTVIEAVKRVLELKKTKPGKPVFSVRKSEEPIQNMRRALERICARAGVEKKANPHLFRHSIATHMLASDVNLRTIQEYLGHSQVQTTAEIYSHVVMDHLRNAQRTVIHGKAE